MIRLVVFDCDGTLVDSQHVIVETMRRVFAGKRLPPPEAEAVRRVVGLSLATAIATLWPQGADDEVAALTKDYRKTFLGLRAQPEHHEPLYPGAAEAVAALDEAGYLLGVATGKSRRGLNATLERFGLLERFVTLQTADDAPSKPHPGMLERAMAEAGAGTHETVLVGDTTFDVEMAVNAGVAALGVGWGYHEAHELRAAGARAIVGSFAELGDAIAALGRP